MVPFGRQPSVVMHYDEGRCMTVGISYKTETEVSAGIYAATFCPNTSNIDVFESLIELELTT